MLVNGKNYDVTNGQFLNDPPIVAKVQNLVAVLAAGTATPLQQQRALAMILSLLLNLQDI